MSRFCLGNIRDSFYWTSAGRLVFFSFLRYPARLSQVCDSALERFVFRFQIALLL